VDYKSPGWEARLRQACPRGVDVYFDNVGGVVSTAVFALLNEFARVPVCGLISQYNGQSESAPNALEEWMRWVLVRRLTVRGFIVSDLARAYPGFTQQMASWMHDGHLRGHAQVVSGLENISGAFLGMLRGDNLGKTLVRIAGPVSP
jgi:NADPH-dependent curcumin reductase CurA